MRLNALGVRVQQKCVVKSSNAHVLLLPDASVPMHRLELLCVVCSRLCGSALCVCYLYVTMCESQQKKVQQLHLKKIALFYK